jgi:hypothetical protein
MASSVIGSLRVNLGIDTAAFSTGLKQAGSRLAGFGAAFRSAIVPLAAAGTAAAVGIGAAVKGTIDAADEMSKAASKFGVPIEELSRLKYAADLSDVSLATLGTSLGALSRNMVKAAEGTGPMAEAFANAGVAVKNADGSLRATTAVLSDISDAFLAMPDGAEKTALAMQLMGRSGREMIPLLQGGSKALADAAAEADKFGQVFTEETGKNSEAFNDNLTRLGGAFKGITVDLTERLLPTLVRFSDWLVQNGPKLAENTANFVDFAARVVAALGTIKPVLDAISDAMHAVVRAIQSAGNAASTFSAQISEGFNSAVSAVQTKLVEMEQALVGFRDRFIQVGRDLIEGLIQGIRERVGGAVSAIKSVGSSIITAMKNAVGVQSPSTVFAGIGQNIVQGLSQGIASMQGGAERDVSTFASNIASTFAQVLTGAQDFRSALSSILSNVGGSLIQKGLGGLVGSLGIPSFANGTGFAPGGLALVGERGAEVVNLPRGSRVTPNSRLGGLGGGQVDVRVSVDQTGNLQAFVTRTAGTVSAQVVKSMAPGVVANAQRRAG